MRWEAEPWPGPPAPQAPQPLALVHAEECRAVAELLEAEEEGEAPCQIPDLQESLSRPDFRALLQQQLCHQLLKGAQKVSAGPLGNTQMHLETPQAPPWSPPRSFLDATHPPRVSQTPSQRLTDPWTTPETPPQTPSTSGGSQTSLEQPKDP